MKYVVQYQIKGKEQKIFSHILEKRKSFLTLRDAIVFSRQLPHTVALVGKPLLEEVSA